MRSILKPIFFIFLACSFAFAIDHDPGARLVMSLGGEISVINPVLSTDTTSSAIEGVIFTG
ncbi:MAG: hypothetical protein ABH860_05370, partial [bacterium]